MKLDSKCNVILPILADEKDATFRTLNSYMYPRAGATSTPNSWLNEVQATTHSSVVQLV